MRPHPRGRAFTHAIPAERGEDTVQTILDAIPTDFASLFTLLLVVVIVVIVVVAGRRSSKGETKVKDPE